MEEGQPVLAGQHVERGEQVPGCRRQRGGIHQRAHPAHALVQVTLTMRGGVRELVVDRGRAFNSLPALEKLAEGTDSYVIEASRLDGDLFEYRLTPL